MRLATPEEVLSVRAITVTDGSLATAGVALDYSYPIVCSLLDTELSEGKVTDYFTIEEGDAENRTRLRTTNAFLDKKTVVVRITANGLPLLSEEDGEVLSPLHYTYSADTGIFRLLNYITSGILCLSITYAHGFSPTDDDENVLDVPDWLKGAAAYMANSVLTTQPASPATKRDNNRNNNYSSQAYRQAVQMLSPHYRMRMSVLYPDKSDVHG